MFESGRLSQCLGWVKGKQRRAIKDPRTGNNQKGYHPEVLGQWEGVTERWWKV